MKKNINKNNGEIVKISIIIPVYNTEKYVGNCLDSIINQTKYFENTEILLIDDGSTDSSATVIKNYVDKYSNIKYFYKTNGGQGSARNIGLSRATGEYVSFIDSDDEVSSNYFESFLSNDSYDIITCNYLQVSNLKEKIIDFKFTDNNVKNFMIMNTGPCNMILRNSFLKKNKFNFPVDIIYEDLAVIPSLALLTSKIKHISEPNYIYNIVSGSTTNKTKYTKKLNDIFYSFEKLSENFENFDIENEYKDELEFLYIRRLLMSASLRFFEFDDPDNSVDKIVSIIKTKYPLWYKNKYYRKLKFSQKIMGLLIYYKFYGLSKNLKKLKNIMGGK